MRERQREQHDKDEEDEHWSDAHSDFPNEQETSFGGRQDPSMPITAPDTPDEREDAFATRMRRLRGREEEEEIKRKEIMSKREKFQKYFKLGIRREDDVFLFEKTEFTLDKLGTRIIALDFDGERIYKLRKNGSRELYSEDEKTMTQTIL